MFGFTFFGYFRVLLTMTTGTARIHEPLLQKRFMFLIRDTALLSKLFAADMAVITVLVFQCLMHGECARTLAVAFDAPVVDLGGERTRQTYHHHRQAHQQYSCMFHRLILCGFSNRAALLKEI
jgi:hypothetical protein